MDLKAQNEKRAVRMQAKRDAIRSFSTSEAESASKVPVAEETK